ncbi:MAG: hypothetical protein ABIL09_14645 [Gemmatimonadota bacterium]
MTVRHGLLALVLLGLARRRLWNEVDIDPYTVAQVPGRNRRGAES